MLGLLQTIGGECAITAPWTAIATTSEGSTPTPPPTPRHHRENAYMISLTRR